MSRETGQRSKWHTNAAHMVEEHGWTRTGTAGCRPPEDTGTDTGPAPDAEARALLREVLTDLEIQATQTGAPARRERIDRIRALLGDTPAGPPVLGGAGVSRHAPVTFPVRVSFHATIDTRLAWPRGEARPDEDDVAYWAEEDCTALARYALEHELFVLDDCEVRAD